VTTISVDILSQEYVRDRPYDYGKIHPQAMAVDILQIESLPALPADVIAPADLSKASETWFSQQLPFFVFGVVTELVNLVGPWAD
jgi:hypothetical protein